MRVIHYENLPARLPFFQSVILWLLLDRYTAPTWVWAVVGTLMVMVWIGSITKMAKQKEIKVV